MNKQTLHYLRSILTYLASEILKAKKEGKWERAEELSVAFKILSKEYEMLKAEMKQ